MLPPAFLPATFPACDDFGSHQLCGIRPDIWGSVMEWPNHLPQSYPPENGPVFFSIDVSQ